MTNMKHRSTCFHVKDSTQTVTSIMNASTQGFTDDQVIKAGDGAQRSNIHQGYQQAPPIHLWPLSLYKISTESQSSEVRGRRSSQISLDSWSLFCGLVNPQGFGVGQWSSRFGQTACRKKRWFQAGAAPLHTNKAPRMEPRCHLACSTDEKDVVWS